MDPRYNKLAEVLTGFSTRLAAGEKVYIDAYDIPDGIVVALIRAARARGADPIVNINQSRVTREMLRGATREQYSAVAKIELTRIQSVDAYIGVRGAGNIFENSDVDTERMSLVQSQLKEAWDYRINKTRWVVLRWPTSSMAQQALMSTEAFEDFYFRVCTLDYARMVPGMDALKQALEATSEVRIVSPGTDLRFSIKGQGAIPCGGLRNIPDGEVYTSPVRNSVEGVITYNGPTVYQGTSFDNIRFVFKEGKIVEESCSGPQKKLTEILNTDAGARYIGEFAIGFNPHILHPMRDTLFDEKIAGSFHFTPGQAYANEADNGNRSQIHWDIVSIQRPDYGGGEMYFDGQLVRKDGIFLVPGLDKLNPEYLLG
ncbi:MAG: aminopeptidase [Verrucomicrobiota bacterium]|nr:aminopeptidase [Verrucomicrobiota bacterium]